MGNHPSMNQVGDVNQSSPLIGTSEPLTPTEQPSLRQRQPQVQETKTSRWYCCHCQEAIEDDPDGKNSIVPRVIQVSPILIPHSTQRVTPNESPFQTRPSTREADLAVNAQDQSHHSHDPPVHEFSPHKALSPAFSHRETAHHPTSRIIKARTPSGDFTLGASKLMYLRSSILASTLGENELLQFANTCDMRTISAGQLLYAQGSHPSTQMFILCSGELCVEVESDGVPTPTFTGIAGDSPAIAATTPFLNSPPTIRRVLSPMNLKSPTPPPPVTKQGSSSNLQPQPQNSGSIPLAELIQSNNSQLKRTSTEQKKRASGGRQSSVQLTPSMIPTVARRHSRPLSLRSFPSDLNLSVNSFKAQLKSDDSFFLPAPQPQPQPAPQPQPGKKAITLLWGTNETRLAVAVGSLQDEGPRRHQRVRSRSFDPTIVKAATTTTSPPSDSRARSGQNSPTKKEGLSPKEGAGGGGGGGSGGVTPIRRVSPNHIRPQPTVIAQPSPRRRISVNSSPVHAANSQDTPATHYNFPLTRSASKTPEPSPSPPSPNTAATAAPIFHRLAVQSRGWMFGLEAVWKLPAPSITAPLASVMELDSQRGTNDGNIFMIPPLETETENTTSKSKLKVASPDGDASTTAPPVEIQSFPRCANVVALTDGTCLTINQQKLEKFLMRFPHTYEPLMASFGQHMESSLATLPFLAHLSPPKVKLFLSLFNSSIVEPNTVLFKEGDPSTDESLYYFIHTGSVRIILPLNMSSLKSPTSSVAPNLKAPSRSDLKIPSTGDDERASRTPSPHHTPRPSACAIEKDLTAGHWFGELSLLLELNRTGTAITTSRCTLLTVNRKTFRNFLAVAPSVLQLFRDNLAQHHLQNDYLLRIPIIQEYFYEFCHKEYSTENLEFVRACARFKDAAEKNQRPNETQVTAPYLIQMARKIYDDFISEKSLTQVNLRSSIRSVIQASLATGAIPFDLFTPAVREIYFLMNSDSFPRFRRGELFQEALRQLNRASSVVNTTQWEEAFHARLLAKEQVDGGSSNVSSPFGPIGHVGGSVAGGRLQVDDDTDELIEVIESSDPHEVDNTDYVDVKELNLPAPPSSDLAVYGELVAAAHERSRSYQRELHRRSSSHLLHSTNQHTPVEMITPIPSRRSTGQNPLMNGFISQQPIVTRTQTDRGFVQPQPIVARTQTEHTQPTTTNAPSTTEVEVLTPSIARHSPEPTASERE